MISMPFMKDFAGILVFDKKAIFFNLQKGIWWGMMPCERPDKGWVPLLPYRIVRRVWLLVP